MTTRTQQIEELMDGLNVLRRKMLADGCFDSEGGRITASQWRVLALVGGRENMSAKEIAGILGVTSSAATQLIDGLVKSEYAVRKTDAKDRRISWVVLSPKAQTFFAEMKKKHRAHMTSLFSALTDDEFDVFTGLYKKMIGGLKN